ncbi:hypothetical protein D3C83_230720 [compost metagenome]
MIAALEEFADETRELGIDHDLADGGRENRAAGRFLVRRVKVDRFGEERKER